jgi:YVTN family beta-propeller protein
MPGLDVGSEFAGHRIVGVLGRGGMGIVYRATKLALDRDRALKVIAPALSSDPRFRERFKRESRMAAAIEHPNVIPVHDAGEEAGMLYLAMRLVEGSDLHRVAVDSGLGVGRAAWIIGGVAEALDAAHAAGLVHRDVKPANVLIEVGEGGEHVYLSDFGITRTTTGGDTLTGTSEFVGSVQYIAPEQAASEPVDARTDVYSLGGVAHFALSGRPPFARDTEMATLFAHANAPRPRPTEADPSLPPEVDDVIARAMAPDPADRYATAGDLASDLARALRLAPGKPTAASLPSPAAAPDETVPLPAERRGWRGVLLAALLAAGAAAIAAVVVLSDGDGAGGGAGPATRSGSPVREPNPAVLASIEVDSPPHGIAPGDDEPLMWVAEPRGGMVEAIDADTDEVVRPSAEVPRPVATAVGFGAIWAPSPRADSVYRLEPIQRRPPRAIPVGEDPSDVAVDANGVWVSNEGSDDVSRIDPDENRVEATVDVGAGAAPRSIATGGGSVWVANVKGGDVIEIDSAAGDLVGSSIPVGSSPSDLAYGNDQVWVVDEADGTLTRISALERTVSGEPIEVGRRPVAVEFGFDYVWIANAGDRTVSAVDPEAFEVVGEARVGRDPADLALGEGSIWTADAGDSTVTRVDPDIG